MKILREWWRRTVSQKDSSKSEDGLKRERYLMGRCIGCGRCDTGQCPVKVKLKNDNH